MQPLLARSESPRLRPKVLIVGSEDVGARIDLMRGLAGSYTLAAAGPSPELAAPFARAGFRYFHYPLSRGLDPVLDVCAVVALRRLMTQFRPLVVHAFDTKPGVYGCLAARLAGVPVVLGTVTGLGSLYVSDGLTCRLVRGVYEGLQTLASHHADLTIFQNRDDRKHFLARRVVPADKAALVLGSGVSTDVLDPARVSDAQRRQVRGSLGIPADAFLVTLVSRVIRTKGVAEFVATARDVRQRFPTAHFLLVGPADRDSVDGFGPAELAEFGRVVNWPGARKDVPRILAASDLFVLPSYLPEGIPRALLEAAAMGLPLITTDSPGCNEVVEDGVNGFLVPARDPAALSRAIVRLLGQPQLCRRFGRFSRQRAVERFDLSLVVEQTDTLYRELLTRKAPLALAGKAISRRAVLQTAIPKRRFAKSPYTKKDRLTPLAEKRVLYHAVKRLLDVLVASSALVVTAPLLLVAALAVKLSSRGPVLYRAKRAGLGGRPFAMLKLRTMRAGTDSPDRKITAEEDDRLTAVGRWLRKFKIDELPQFWNVLRGEMSVVGPRPEDWDIVQQHYPAEWRRALEVRPGIASPVDVHWYPDLTYHDPAPAGVPIQEHYLRRHLPAQVAEAIRYTDRQSLLLDFQVILRLIYCVLVRSWLPPKKRPLHGEV